MPIKSMYIIYKLEMETGRAGLSRLMDGTGQNGAENRSKSYQTKEILKFLTNFLQIFIFTIENFGIIIYFINILNPIKLNNLLI